MIFFFVRCCCGGERTPYSIIRVMIIMAARLYVNFVRHNQHDAGTETNPYMKRYDFRRRRRRQATIYVGFNTSGSKWKETEELQFIIAVFFSSLFSFSWFFFNVPLFVALQQTIITIFIHDKKRTTHDPTANTYRCGVWNMLGIMHYYYTILLFESKKCREKKKTGSLEEAHATCAVAVQVSISATRPANGVQIRISRIWRNLTWRRAPALWEKAAQKTRAMHGISDRTVPRFAIANDIKHKHFTDSEYERRNE